MINILNSSLLFFNNELIEHKGIGYRHVNGQRLGLSGHDIHHPHHQFGELWAYERPELLGLRTGSLASESIPSLPASPHVVAKTGGGAAASADMRVVGVAPEITAMVVQELNTGLNLILSDEVLEMKGEGALKAMEVQCSGAVDENACAKAFEAAVAAGQAAF